MALAIITDSCADLFEKEREMFDIDFFPMLVFFGEERYKDWRTIQPEDLYNRFYTSNELPLPSQSPPKEIINAYQRAIDKGYKEIIVLTISRKLSATYDSAIRLTARYPDIKFKVIDSKHVSTAVGFMALLAAVLNRREYTLNEIVKQISILRDNITTYFSIENLENLKRLGRLSVAQYKLAKAFKIIPIMGVDKEGSLVTISKVRNKKDTFLKLREFAVKGLDKKKPIIFGINHGDRLEIAEKIFQDFKKWKPDAKGRIGWVGSVIGTHTGPGIIGCAAFEDKWKLIEDLPFLK